MTKYVKQKVLLLFSLFLLFLYPFLSDTISTRLTAADIDSSFCYSLKNGIYQDDISVGINLHTNSSVPLEIHYTVDGSVPTSQSSLYTAPLSYQAGETPLMITINSIVCNKKGQVLGGPYTGTYLLCKDPEIYESALIVSLTANAEGLYSPETGILYPMQDCGPTEADWKWYEKQNCKQRTPEWIRNAHLDIFESDGVNVVSQNVGLCVDGDHGSMTHYPYSLKILAGTEYDTFHPDFQYDFFHYYNKTGTDFPHIQNYTNMVFRNGGNEYNAGASDPEQRGSMLRWNIGSRLADEAGFLVAGGRPAIIYLNGELYGVTQLQDTYNRHNTSEKTGLVKDNIEIYKNAEKACTELGGYADLYYSYPDIAASPIFNNQAAFENKVSLDDMFAYYAFEVLVNNTDYPKKNYAIWRYTGQKDDANPYSDGLFRFFVNDLDCTYDFRYDDDLWVAYFHHIKEDGTLMGTVTQIPEYKVRFINILCDLMNSGLFGKEHLEQVINEAENDFKGIASLYYSEADETKRQQNVSLLRETAYARQEKVRGYLQETFAPQYPYTLSVAAPDCGSMIHFSTTHLAQSDGNFSGTYYGDYPLTLSYTANALRNFSCWEINGKKVTSSEVTLNASTIMNGQISVRLITVPVETEQLLISEVCSGTDSSWIELYNPTETPIALEGYVLSNNQPAFAGFKLPAKTLAPGEVFLAGIDNTGIFRMDQENNIYLTKSGKLLDSVTIPKMAKTESYGRRGETDEWRYYANPTPGIIN